MKYELSLKNEKKREILVDFGRSAFLHDKMGIYTNKTHLAPEIDRLAQNGLDHSKLTWRNGPGGLKYRPSATGHLNYAGTPIVRLRVCGATYGGPCPLDPVLSGSPVVASGGVLSDGYEHGGPGVCLGDGQTEVYLRDMGMTVLASAWAMARRKPK